MVAVARVGAFGTFASLDNRYVAEAGALAAIALCLAFLPIRLDTETGTTEARAKPLTDWMYRHKRQVQAGVFVLINVIVLADLHSSSGYVRQWKDPDAKNYFATIRTELAALQSSRLEIFDQTVPRNVVPPLLFPANTLNAVLTEVPGRPRFVTTTENPTVPDEQGHLHRGDVEGITTAPGPHRGCGWLVQQAGLEIPLTEPVYTWFWVMKLNYMAQTDTTATIRLGGFSRTIHLRRGPNTLYIKADTAGSTAVRLEHLPPGISVCVDSVIVGNVHAKERLLNP
jgi:hypothetical protein